MRSALLLFLAVPAFAAEPHFNDVFRMATHNSYWIQRSTIPEAYASGTQERILDQLLFDRARALEIDIHPAGAGQWEVYHTNDQSNSICTPLAECLRQLQLFQRALPEHETLTIMLELKAIVDPNFDAAHRPEDLDRILEEQLGPWLYRPRDFLARCAPGMTMRECAKVAGWPLARELRGKFLFAVLGNWRWCGTGHGPSGWADYAQDVGARSAFPMESDWTDFSHDSCHGEYVEPTRLARAKDASIIRQVEDVYDPRHLATSAQFLAENGLIRGGSGFSLDEQRQRVSHGFQFLQTDYPWFRAYDEGLSRPLMLLPDRQSLEPLTEPGSRMLFAQNASGHGRTFQSEAVFGSESSWETLVTSTRASPDPKYANLSAPQGRGCLVASESKDLARGAYVAICRQTAENGGMNLTRPFVQDSVVTLEVGQGPGKAPAVSTFY
ncbi:MAG: hypothetical protein ACXVBW_04560, partial [Bdellovibrionota bacterium]